MVTAYTLVAKPRYVRERRGPAPEEGLLLRLYRLGIFDWWQEAIQARRQYVAAIVRAHEARTLDY